MLLYNSVAPITTEQFEALLRPYLVMMHMELDPSQVSLLLRHLNLLLRWNQKLNLTSVRDPPEIVRRHFAESLFLGSLLPIDIRTVADIGSGAGFPGFPIAVLQPSAQVSLVESVAKKAAFLKELCRGTPNTTVIHGRFERLSASFDCGVVRGVSALRLLPQFARRLRCLALLLGREPARDISSTNFFDWGEAVPLPWESDRVALLGYKATSRRSTTS